jgi:hypothetical protein
MRSRHPTNTPKGKIMNTRKNLLIAGALIAAACAMGSHAASTANSAAQSTGDGEGYYSQYPDPSAQKPLKPESARELERDKQFAAQMWEGEGYISQYPVTPRGPTPQTPQQIKRDKDFAAEMAEGEGYISNYKVTPRPPTPQTVQQIQRDKDFASEMAEGDTGN